VLLGPFELGRSRPNTHGIWFQNPPITTREHTQDSRASRAGDAGVVFFRARSRYRGGGDDDDVHTATRADADDDADDDADFAR